MKMIDDVIIIGIDSGYGNIKTANCCFPASVSTYDKEPVFKENLLVFESKFYLIGEGHKEFLADKTRDLDYYVLALAAIARELNIRKMTCGKIRIAAGLPLTWVSGQRDEFRDYLLQNKAVDFSFRNVSYHVEIVGVDVFPQGFAAVADRLSDFRGVNMICDIGNGTMNIMFINDKKPVSGNMFTEKYGTHQCLLAVRENVMRAHHTTVDEAIINRVFRFGTADIKEDYLKTITDTATDYVEGIFQRLREHEYNPELMRLYVLGGGSCLIRNFGVYDASCVTINDDICATAKGYIDEACMTGISNNLVIYGHHMNNGSMFADLCKYADADFCKEHPEIAFDTLSSLGKYEVVAAFKFNTNRETFKYNEYTLMDEVQFAEFMENVRARQLYDTGVTAEYGDQLLTLSTCEYTYPNGRFVVVAKKV